jgi:hypothetical protein
MIKPTLVYEDYDNLWIVPILDEIKTLGKNITKKQVSYLDQRLKESVHLGIEGCINQAG